LLREPVLSTSRFFASLRMTRKKLAMTKGDVHRNDREENYSLEMTRSEGFMALAYHDNGQGYQFGFICF